MKKILFQNATLYKEDKWIEDPIVKIEDGKINSIESNSASLASSVDQVFVYPNHVKIVPGFIDIHIHGVENGDVMDGTVTSLELMKRALPKEGTTSFLATTITQTTEKKHKALSQVKNVMTNSLSFGAEILGVHLEGPFLCAKRAGAQPKEYIKTPSIDMFYEFYQTAGNQIKLVTLAPEEEMGIDLVRELKKLGIIPAIGHSDANYEQTREAVIAGVTHATHVCNGMTGIHHRDIGILGGVLLHAEIIAELIVDGIHVSPEMVKLIYKNKGAKGIILITDSMRAKGLVDGEYDLGGQTVTVKDKRATLKDGTLAGSIVKMNEAVKNMIAFSGCTFEEAIQMATLNPAKQLRLHDRKGSLSVGKDCDLVVLDDDFEVVQTFVKGKVVYESSLKEGRNHEYH
ncbi:N-acetylglucosamine-6-phosphate deacetylase [Evansella sp. AB-rgal1]|uniref:N-acetylglucosamine-6-phosphate deacetylase n=1 Tax=Evansella sp. AB-rgal1 TaxID=3242696 RepID=UPI00359DAFA7